MTIAQGKHDYVYKNTSNIGVKRHISALYIIIWSERLTNFISDPSKCLKTALNVVMTKDEIIYIVTLIFVCLG